MRKRPILINVGNKSLVILHDGSIYESCSLINSYIVSACEMCDLYFVCEGLNNKHMRHYGIEKDTSLRYKCI